MSVHADAGAGADAHTDTGAHTHAHAHADAHTDAHAHAHTHTHTHTHTHADAHTGAHADARLRAVIGVILVVQLALLAVVGWVNRFQIGPDGVAYVQIASYYASGDLDRCVSGYWGPLLSWLIAPVLGVVGEPVFAARLAMAFSALVLTAGTVAVLRTLALPRAAVGAGAAVAAVMGVRFSVDDVSPDLLLAGLLALGTAGLLARDHGGRRGRQVLTGVAFGAAYLAKSIALPIFVLLLVASLMMRWRSGEARPRRQAGPLAVTALACAATIAPWVAVLSMHYGRPLFSTSARIAHTIVGPADVDRTHPFGRTIAVPAPGRLTVWEDPSAMAYAPWSPFESRASMTHQLHVVAANARVLLRHLGALDGLYLGAIAALVALGGAMIPGGRRPLAAQRWRWAAPAVVCLVVLYLPVYALALRYYFAVVPFLFAAAMGLALHLTRGDDGRRPARLVLAGAVVASFAVPHVAAIPALCTGADREPVARILARRLDERGLVGPVAGDTMEGLMLAFFLDAPFHGGFPRATPDDYRASGAGLIVAVRAYPIAAELDRAPGFESLDAALFPSAEAAAAFPVQVFRLTDG